MSDGMGPGAETLAGLRETLLKSDEMLEAR